MRDYRTAHRVCPTLRDRSLSTSLDDVNEVDRYLAILWPAGHCSRLYAPFVYATGEMTRPVATDEDVIRANMQCMLHRDR